MKISLFLAYSSPEIRQKTTIMDPNIYFLFKFVLTGNSLKNPITA